MAGAAIGDFLNDSRGVKCCNFQRKMLAASSKRNLACEAGSGLTLPWSDHSRMVPALEMTCHLFLRIFLNFGVSFFVAGAAFGEVGGGQTFGPMPVYSRRMSLRTVFRCTDSRYRCLIETGSRIALAMHAPVSISECDGLKHVTNNFYRHILFVNYQEVWMPKFRVTKF